MRTDLLGYILGSEKRKKIVKTLLDYPRRQWTCSSLEELTKLSHATVFRVMVNLRDWGILKQYKLSRKMVVYELVRSPLLEEVGKIWEAEKKALVKMAKELVSKIKGPEIISVVLFGSVAENKFKKDSDIDVFVLIKKENKKIKERLFGEAGKISAKYNRTVSPAVMEKKELKKLVRKKDKFALNILRGELLYGKSPS